MTEYILCFVLFCIGLYGVLRKRNIIKIIIALGIIEYAVNLFFVLIGYRANGRAPILAKNEAITKLTKFTVTSIKEVRPSKTIQMPIGGIQPPTL